MLEDSTERRFSCQKNGEDFVYRAADGSVKLAGRDQVSPKNPPSERNTLARGEEHNDVFQGELDGSLNHQTTRMTQKPGMISGVFSGNHIYRHHVEPRVELYVPKEGSLPVPLK